MKIKHPLIKWLLIAISFITLSASIYFLHFLIFKDIHHIFLYLIGDIAFIPIDILLVTLIFHKVLTARDKTSMMKKLNMVIGAFFNETGRELILKLLTMDNNKNELIKLLKIEVQWDKKQFLSVIKNISAHKAIINYSYDKINELKEILFFKRDFLLRLLENSNLLEHETFTDLLWAVFHLTDELQHRKDLTELSKADREHLSIDIFRVYNSLIKEWIYYLIHLKADYPFLFSLAVRMNPFNPGSKAEID